VDGHREASSEFRLAEEEQTEPVLGVHLIVGEEAEVFEDLGAQVMGFVDDENGADARVGAEARDLTLDLPMEGGPRPLDGQVPSPRRSSCRGP
jgi:hypothetical protein